MELIRKSDALNAVLHHQGDAAVAAVQNIKPINPHGELREMLIDEIIDRMGDWEERYIDDANPMFRSGAKMDGERKDGERRTE